MDVRLQYRNGFYYAAAFVAVFWMLGLARVPDATLDKLLPVFILSNLVINTFYFISGLVLLEKMEGTLTMLDVTPLRPLEYLSSKAATLVFLSLLENLVIVLVARGPEFRLLPLAAGIAAGGALYVLAGFVAVSRYPSINEFLFPSFLYILAFVPPFLPYLGLMESRWYFYLHPVQAPLLLVQAAFRPTAVWELAYGAGYSLLWAGLGLVACRSAFARLRRAPEGSLG